MNYKEQSGQTIKEAFAEFHQKNPAVYSQFKVYFDYLHKYKGWQKVSAKLIIERIRAEVLVKTSDPEFKIDNNFTAHYVRLFVSENPQYEKCFEFRSLKS